MSSQAAHAYITGQMINDGFTLRTDTPSQLVCWRYGKQSLMQAEWGYVVSFTLIDQSPKGTRVVSDAHMMFAVGTPHVRVYDSSFRNPSDPQENVYKQVDAILAGLRSK